RGGSAPAEGAAQCGGPVGGRHRLGEHVDEADRAQCLVFAALVRGGVGEGGRREAASAQQRQQLRAASVREPRIEQLEIVRARRRRFDRAGQVAGHVHLGGQGPRRGQQEGATGGI